MAKRILTMLLALTLLMGAVGGALAADTLTFDTVAARDVPFLATAESALAAEVQPYAAATLFLEYILYQNRNNLMMENRPLWKDCVIGSKDALIMLAFDLGDGMLLLTYDTVGGKMSTMISTAYVGAEGCMQAMENSGVTAPATVSGDAWTTVLAQILMAVTEE